MTTALVLLLGASMAQAKDLCVFYTSGGGFNYGGNLIVLERYSPPRPGDCKPVQGFVADTATNDKRQAPSGTACPNSAGTTLVLSHNAYPGTISGPDGPWITGYYATVALSYPWLNGGRTRISFFGDGVPIGYADSRAQTCVGTATLR